MDDLPIGAPGGFVVGGQQVGAGSFLSDSQDHFRSNVAKMHAGQQSATPNGHHISPLELSRSLQARLKETRGVDATLPADTPEELTRRLRMNIEAMHVELAELLHETPWKEWKSYPPEWYDDARMAAIKEEAIDLHFFLNNIYIALGMTDQDIQLLFEMKWEKNMARQADGGEYR